MVKVYKRDGKILLIRMYFPCPHRTINGNPVRHVHYYVTSEQRLKELGMTLDQLIEWLECGFWWDSGIESSEPIVQRFLNHQCLNNTHW
jgi:hypothetical protein